jgi:hypothetical protein
LSKPNATQFFSNDVLVLLVSWRTGSYAARIEQLYIQVIQPIEQVAAGHRLKISSVSKEENMKHSVV